ncbi:MAG TPA: hypothetical protein PKA88_27580, partial [Polyangiaceae bacterium]|nr:hypothetical protein [Polyangiaceae bacterium]
MKVKTIGWMAALGMVFSSVTVWSLTKPKSWDAKTVATADTALATGPLVQDPSSNDTGAQFRVGSVLELSGRLGHSALLTGNETESYILATVRAQTAG